jgi:hypothetical protein
MTMVFTSTYFFAFLDLFLRFAFLDLGVFLRRFLPPVVSLGGSSAGFSFASPSLAEEAKGFSPSSPDSFAAGAEGVLDSGDFSAPVAALSALLKGFILLSALIGLSVISVRDSIDLEIVSPIPTDVAYANTAVVTPIRPYVNTGTPSTCKFTKSAILKLYILLPFDFLHDMPNDKKQFAKLLKEYM